MKKLVKYIALVYLPKCDYCNSNILQVEEYYFVAIEGNRLTDVRIVHRECFNGSRERFIEEEYKMVVKDIVSLMFEAKNENVKEKILIDDENCDVYYKGRMELLFNAYEDFIDGDTSSLYSKYYPILTMEVREIMLGVCDFKGRYFEINLVV